MFKLDIAYGKGKGSVLQTKFSRMNEGADALPGKNLSVEDTDDEGVDLDDDVDLEGLGDDDADLGENDFDLDDDGEAGELPGHDETDEVVDTNSAKIPLTGVNKELAKALLDMLNKFEGVDVQGAIDSLSGDVDAGADLGTDADLGAADAGADLGADDADVPLLDDDSSEEEGSVPGEDEMVESILRGVKADIKASLLKEASMKGGLPKNNPKGHGPGKTPGTKPAPKGTGNKGGKK